MIPSSDLLILKGVPFNSDGENLLTFNSITEQTNYFQSLAKFPVTNDFSYMRKEVNTPIRIDIEADKLYDCNYIMFRNDNYSNKWFYAFINHVEYVADGTSFIYFTDDLYQSWQFDFVFKKCFVEREHVTNDSKYANTVPENLELGDLIITNTKTAAPEGITSVLNFDPHIFIGATNLPYDINHPDLDIKGILEAQCTVIKPGFYSGALNGLYFLDCGSIMLQEQDVIAGKMNSIINIYNTSQYTIDSISMIFVSPPVTNEKYIDQYDIDPIPNTYSGYTPQNNKLYCYPYTYMSIEGPQGRIDLKYEDFSTSTKIKSGFSFGAKPTYGIWVDNYKEYTEYSVFNAVSPFPVGSWTFSAWTNWVNQNGLSAVLGMVSQTVGLGASIVSLNPTAIAGGIAGIGSSMAKMTEQAKMPDGLKGSAANPDFWFAANNWIPDLVRRQIKPEYARIIDEYFTRYGYKVNRVKVPNINTRSNFNYVKTIDAIVAGNAPENARNYLAGLLNKGVTFWHTSNIGG